MNALVQDASGGSRDVVAASAVEDFYKILISYMDPELRATFTPTASGELQPEVRRIAQDQPLENAAFYQELQVPYLTAVLSGARQPSAKLLDGATARKQLEELCASSDVFRRHARALHALHWKKKWPVLNSYLEDQRAVDRSQELYAAFDRLQVHLRAQQEAARDSERTVRFDALLSKLEGLRDWALTRKLYWATRLYSHLTLEWMPKLRSRLADAEGTEAVGRELRSYSALLAILEETDRNPRGLTFHEAFLETVRAFTFATTLPRYTDYRGNPERFSEAVDGLFTEFKQRYTHSGIVEIELALHQWGREVAAR
ncbi:hypothetical protein [Hyalangium gracile]|uniref:hypothetical protein n=1 Tax=Hyalangium gracile TaxID=394092 RepID=UPI001CCE8167|nr:hypothetical protein [Hyalangium gracile]